VARFVENGEARGPQGVRGRRISLIGLRGAGKTTLGAGLAQRLGCPFVELDKLIEREHGAEIAMLFEVYGQATFRRYEREALVKVVAAHESAVIATAGGIVAEEDSFALLRATTHVAWLKASPAEHMQRVMEQGDFRPMGRNREAMKDLIAILEAREAEYGRAHAQLDTSGRTVEACVEELAGIAERLFASGT
jgi:XRE family aerobic/anaerobic benzoate catabolism transcriptional regulator